MRPKSMRIVFLFFFYWFSCSPSFSEVIYDETFGSEVDRYEVVSAYQGWSESGYVYDGTARVASFSTYACNLSGSSGAAYLYFPSVGFDRFLVKGLNTASCVSVELSFHARVDTGDDVLRVNYSTDGGATWQPVSFSERMTSVWQKLVNETQLPVSADWMLKIEREKGTNGILFIDDIRLTSSDSSPTIVPSPVFSHASGTYYEPFDLTLACPSSDALLYYTLDGTFPSSSSLRYTSPIRVSSDVIVRAVACLDASSSEVVTADYCIETLRTYMSIGEMKAGEQWEDQIKLVLSNAVVTAVDGTGFFMQDDSGGLYVACISCPYRQGDVLTGYLVGMCTEKEGLYGLRDVFCGGASVCENYVSADACEDWADILSAPGRYYGCLVSMNRATLGTDGMLRSEVDGYEVAWYDYFSVVPVDYDWTSGLCVMGLLLPCNGAPSLAVRTLLDLRRPAVYPLPSVGTVLVCEDDKGFHAMTHTLSGGALGSERVYMSGGEVVLTRRQKENGNLFWETDATKGRLRIPGGSYLSGSSTTTLKLYTSAGSLPSNARWKQDEERGWRLTLDKTERALLYSSSVFKLYAPSNIGASGYANQAATDVPAYLGFVRTVTPGRFGTLCLPYDVAGEDLGGTEVYSIAGKHVDALGRATDIVLKGPLSSVSAGVPYLFRATTGTLVFRYSGEEVLSASAVNGLVGSLTGINVNGDGSDETLSDYFVLSNNTFRLCAPGSSLGEERAYLDLESVPVLDASVKGFSLPLENTATTVPFVQEATPSCYPVYNMQGIRVAYGSDFHVASRGLSSGLYLYRGRKYLVP